ncbi:MAG: glycoside hydrolase family 3 [Oscillospiraceae bacterium]|nr:glycoside hydrolase family 3 [Oscillospiraceae bacterium]
MSEKPQQQKNTKKRRDSDAGIRRFLAILLSAIALCMMVMVFYTLRHSTTDPTVAEGKTMNWTPEESLAATEMNAATEATEPTEPLDPVLYAAQQTLSGMTLEEKVYQLFFVTNRELTGLYYANTAGEETRAALASKPVGGVVFDRDNIFGRDQLAAMIKDMQSYTSIPLFVGVEEEGGIELYSYLRTIGVTGRYSEMGVYGDGNESDRVYEIGSEIGTALTGVGFNIDLAPVADTLVNNYNPELGVAGGRRAFSSDPETTAGLVTQMVKGLHSGGCMSCLKYFPGLSASYTDSRYGEAVSNQTLEEIRQNLLAFKAGIENGAEMIMVSHLCLPNVVEQADGENRPAAFCPEIVTDLLRGELGYDGVVITDSFEKGAISYNYEVGIAAIAAIQAGCDVIYMPSDLEAAAQAIITAVNNGILDTARIDESVLRILTLKYSHGLE